MKQKCIDSEFLEYITEIEPILCADHNGEAYVCGSEEVCVGTWCYKREEYNLDCNKCKFKESD